MLGGARRHWPRTRRRALPLIDRKVRSATPAPATQPPANPRRTWWEPTPHRAPSRPRFPYSTHHYLSQYSPFPRCSCGRPGGHPLMNTTPRPARPRHLTFQPRRTWCEPVRFAPPRTLSSLPLLETHPSLALWVSCGRGRAPHLRPAHPPRGGAGDSLLSAASSL